jgi:hypothetical protein
MKLENQPLFVRPQTFHLNFAPLIGLRLEQRPKPHAFAEAIRNIGVEFDGDFSAASLGFDDPRQGNKLAAWLRCRYSIISSA